MTRYKTYRHHEMKTARDILDLWPTRAEVARDIGYPDVTVRAWGNRNRIASAADVALVNAAKRRGFDLTFEELARSRAGASA